MHDCCVGSVHRGRRLTQRQTPLDYFNTSKCTCTASGIPHRLRPLCWDTGSSRQGYVQSLVALPEQAQNLWQLSVEQDNRKWRPNLPVSVCELGPRRRDH